MLECVTLAQVIEVVVEVLVDFSGTPILSQEATENAETTHPYNLAVQSALFFYNF